MKSNLKPMRLSLILTGFAILMAVNLPAADYYVATNGVNTNPGTLAAPFQTIQKAASVMVAGDTCYIRGGTYRETVIPANSGAEGAPITYQNYSNEVAVISGTEVITGWTLDAATTYKTALASNFFASPYNQTEQVFVDGNMMTLAKWPNATVNSTAYPSGTAPAVDVSHPAKSVITSFISKTTTSGITTGVVGDTALPAQAAGFYSGAEIFFQPNNGGWSWTLSGVVSNVTGSQITFTSVNASGSSGTGGGNYAVGSRYYLFNKKEFLDAPGEWWHDRSNAQLFAIMPDNGNPAAHTVEVKKREFAFDLSNKSYITVKGLNLFACTITTDTAAGGTGQPVVPPYTWRGSASGIASSHHIILDGLDAKYLFHFTDVAGHFFLQWGQGSGIVLSGSDCILKNSTIQYSAGNGVTVLGQRNKVLNNSIYDTAYAGTDAAAINTGQAAITQDHEIANNIVRRTGRSGMTPRSLKNSNAAGGQFLARIHHNDIGDCGIQDWDVAGIYITGDGRFLRIDHNRIHDLVGFTCSGVYPDWSKNYIIDHNEIWNVEWGIHLQRQESGTALANCLVYNNTVAVKNTSSSPYGPFGIVDNWNPGTNNGTVLLNNLNFCQNKASSPGYAAISSFGWAGATIGTNYQWDSVLNSATDPKFVDAANFNFQLQANSPARGAGVVVPTYFRDGVSVPPFSENPAGNRDQGAFEYFDLVFLQGANFTIAVGNANAWIDPGETVQEQLILNNQSTGTLTNVNAALSITNAGITLLTGMSAYADTAVGALGTNVVPFSYRLATNVPAGTLLNFTHVTSANGRLYTNTFSRVVGQTINNYFTNTIFSTNVPKTITDYVSSPGVIYSTNNLAGISGAVDRVVVGVRVDHTYDGDLAIAVQHPDSTEVMLSNRRGGAGDNFGSTVGSTTNYTVFDDAASTAIASGSPAYVGSYNPDAPLANFNGKSANGLWRLRISDNAAGDSGTLLRWYLQITTHNTTNVAAVFYPPWIAQIASPTNQSVQLTFGGVPGGTYLVQTATNLAGPWINISTNTADGNGQWIFNDPNAANTQQFYRVQQH